ncbi:MAG: hypothetical protein KF745_04055 [Phycisphaeraceae bacterium]|nr:hypothetical protein [Phycisphaeraceae bacterium]
MPRVMPVDNTIRGRLATLLRCIGLLCVLLAAVSVRAAMADGDEPPPPASTMAAYRTLETWIRKPEVPADAAEGLPECYGACVTLRLDGKIVGRGSSISLAASRDVVRRAVTEAINEAERRIPKGSDLLAEEAVRESWKRITISLELAGGLTPITPATVAEAELMLAPGLDGIASRVGGGADAPMAAIYPSQMLSANTLPQQAIGATAAMAGGDAQLGLVGPAELREKHGVTSFRFRVTHLAQPGPGEEPVFLQRGGRVVGRSEVSSRGAMRAMAERITAHLLRRAAEEDAAGELTRTERGLIGGALQRFSMSVRPLTERERETAKVLVMDFSRPESDVEDAIDKAIGVCLTAPAMVTVLREQGVGQDEIGRAISPWTATTRAFSRVFDAKQGYRSDLPPAARGAVAYALVTLVGLERAAGSADTGPVSASVLAPAAVRTAFRDVEEGQLAGQMPWLGWAELKLADLERPVGAPRGGASEIPAGVALRRMRERLWQHQLQAIDAGVDNQDLIGGVTFTSTRNPLPTWQSARPLAFVATMLGDPRLTEGAEFNRELVRLLEAVRFMRQLQVDESNAWMYPEPARAIGGIRAAVWDSRQPVEASAFTLMAVCEVLTSLESAPRDEAESGSDRRAE